MTDPELRQALHGLYVALFNARQSCPDVFGHSRLTTIQTAIMGIEDFGWRVIGITREALDLLATVNFDKTKLPRRLCRGHIFDRVQTARQLFDRDNPMDLEEFFTTFLHNDRTVIMLNEQNKHATTFPEYIEIENPNSELFPNGGLISWKHRKRERDFLRQLRGNLAAT